jgi:hypothetical protein
LAYGFQESVSRSAIFLVHHDQRLVDQPTQHRQHVVISDISRGANRFGRFQTAVGCKHGEAAEHRALLEAEEAVAPVKGGA